MCSRRVFLNTSLGLLACSSVFNSCSTDYPDSGYNKTVEETWKHSYEAAIRQKDIYRELVRYATLAASSHNTQCWNFKLENNGITILPDYSRRCPVVDPDDHHLFSSLGCAAENLVHAARNFGLESNVSYDKSGDRINLEFEKSKPVSTKLFKVIPLRQSTRSEYDGEPLSSEELRLLETAAGDENVNVILFTDSNKIENILEYVIQGNTSQVNDPEFVEELKEWIRFSESEALKKLDGLYSKTTGNPSVPRWLGELMFRFFFTAGNENEKYAKQVRSSSGIAIFVSVDNKKNWINAGRAYERFALQAAALGLKTAFINQPVEVATLRSQFATWLGIGARRPDLIIRFGRGPDMPRTLRRPVESVII